MAYRITYWPKAPSKPHVEDRIGVIDTIVEARAFAISRANSELPETELIEIEGAAAERELWIYRNHGWERDDNAQKL